MDDIYVDMTFGDKNEAYVAYNSYELAKGFGIRRSRITKPRQTKKQYKGNMLVMKNVMEVMIRRGTGRDISTRYSM